ncbi:MAG: response regulator [Candidatus Binataceae bacterium]
MPALAAIRRSLSKRKKALRRVNLVLEKNTILVVDDDEDCREALVFLLSSEGYRVISASDGREALECLHRSPAALIILDLMMPVMDGWEFRRRQKDDPQLKSVPVVVLTAAWNPYTIDAQAIIRKPIDVEALIAAVKQNCAP